MGHYGEYSAALDKKQTSKRQKKSFSFGQGKGAMRGVKKTLRNSSSRSRVTESQKKLIKDGKVDMVEIEHPQLEELDKKLILVKEGNRRLA